MPRRSAPRLRPVLALAFLLAAGPDGSAVAQAAGSSPAPSPAEVARRDGGIPPYAAADVQFMQGMIGHHAQAIRMTGWAPSHGARADIQRLAERIVVAQQDEIAFMQRWLRDRNQTVPDPASPHAGHDMHAMHADSGHAGMEGSMGTMRMPGMLTDAELAQLDAARGPEFDRLFLTYMIRHHEGAVSMVERLFGSNGAAQDDDVFKFASDVSVDQTTEVARMRSMLEAMPAPARP